MTAPTDLSALREFDTPDVVAPAFRRFRLWLLALLLAVAAAAAFAGYSVDKVRTESLSELLRRADELQTHPVEDDPLPYFSLHNDLAAASGVAPCSAFAVRMTQRFLPDGWRFVEADVAALDRGETIVTLLLDMAAEVPSRWQC